MGKTFVADGYVFAQCIKRNGIETCKKDGKYYKFPFYLKSEKQKTSSDEEVPDEDLTS